MLTDGQPELGFLRSHALSWTGVDTLPRSPINHLKLNAKHFWWPASELGAQLFFTDQNNRSNRTMSDLSDLEGVYPSSLRFNAEEGFLAVSGYSAETGRRELTPIEFGIPFVMDMATRERGYGYVRVGVYNMRLTPVGSPPPPPPDDPGFKLAVGCWLWCPSLGELRLETNGVHFLQAISDIWDRARSAPEAAAGLQPIIRFVDCLAIWNKKHDKTFFAPNIDIVGWVEREKVPGWSARTPTVSLPSPLPVLPVAAAAPSSPSEPAATNPAKVTPAAVKDDDSLSEPLDDDLPDSLK